MGPSVPVLYPIIAVLHYAIGFHDLQHSNGVLDILSE